MNTTTTAAKGPKARRSYRSHRLAGLGAALVASAAVVLAGGSAAQASYQDGQPYLADDWCNYSVVNGAWTGDWCVRTYADAIGAVYPKVYSIYSYDASATDHLGSLTMQIDDRDPQYLVFRDPNSAVFANGVWARQLRGNATAPVEIQTFDTASNAWTWSVLSTPSASSGTGSPGSTTQIDWGSWTAGMVGGGGSSSTGNAYIDKMMNDFNIGLIKPWVAPECNYSYNGCA